MHYQVVKGILSPQNGMNLYRGCSHGCIYCDARSTCYQMKHEFEDIEVKINAPELLDATLKKKRKKCMVGTGAMSDPYLHIEKQLQLTRSCLKLIEKYGYGVTLQTKSDLVLRDLDILKKINDTTKCVIQMTLTTYDEKLCKIVEPNVCGTKRRVEVLNVFKKEKIPTIVWLTPILPFLNDTEKNISGIVEYCAETKVYGILSFGMGLTLRDGDRQYYYQKLDQHFPGMKEKYMKCFGNAYEIPSPNQRNLLKIFHEMCNKYHIETDSRKIFAYLHELKEKNKEEQLTLFDQ